MHPHLPSCFPATPMPFQGEQKWAADGARLARVLLELYSSHLALVPTLGPVVGPCCSGFVSGLGCRTPQQPVCPKGATEERIWSLSRVTGL